MKGQLDLYVRSLTEREHGRLAPQNRQDLGTFLAWLLDGLGYELVVPPFLMDGRLRVSNAGYDQAGVDVFAMKEVAGQPCLHRFILKAGDIKKSNFDGSGSIRDDMNRVLDRSVEKDLNILLPGDRPPGLSVATIVVHNGDVQTDQVGERIEEFRKRFEKERGTFEWWSARHLVDKALEVLADTDREMADVFPPAIRPFASLVLNGLRKSGVSIDHLRLALDAWIIEGPDTGQGRPAADELQAYRGTTELAFFAALAGRAALEADSVPWLDLIVVLERTLCRVADLARHHTTSRFDDVLRLLAGQFVEIALAMGEKLEPIRRIEDGLALVGQSERLDYPIRTWWLFGRVAVAVRLARDLDMADAEGTLVALLGDFFTMGRVALAMPVTDDVVAEFAIAAEVLVLAGRAGAVRDWSASIVHHLAMRRVLGLPGPSTWHRAGLPLDPSVAAALAGVWISRPSERPTFGFADTGSTLLAVCTWLNVRLGAPMEDPWSAFRAGTTSLEGGRLKAPRPGVTPQTWMPPEDLWKDWYRTELATVGVSHLYELDDDLDRFAATFEGYQGEVPESPMALRRLGGIDAVASLVHRHPPPLFGLVRVVKLATAAPDGA